MLAALDEGAIEEELQDERPSSSPAARDTSSVEQVESVFIDACKTKLEAYELRRRDALGRKMRSMRGNLARQLEVLQSTTLADSAAAPGMISSALSQFDDLVSELSNPRTEQKQRRECLLGIRNDNSYQIDAVRGLATSEGEQKSLWTRKTSSKKLEVSQRAASQSSAEAQQNLSRSLGESKDAMVAQAQAEIAAMEAVTETTKVLDEIRADDAKKSKHQRLETETTIKRLRNQINVVTGRIRDQEKYLSQLMSQVTCACMTASNCLIDAYH